MGVVLFLTEEAPELSSIKEWHSFSNPPVLRRPTGGHLFPAPCLQAALWAWASLFHLAFLKPCCLGSEQGQASDSTQLD